MLPLNLIAFFLGYLQKARTLFDLADDASSTFMAIAWSGGGKSSFNRIQSNCVSGAWCGRQMGPRWLPKKGLLKRLLAALYQRFWSWPDLYFPSQPVSVNPWSIFSFKNKRYCLNSELSEYVLEYEMFPLCLCRCHCGKTIFKVRGSWVFSFFWPVLFWLEAMKTTHLTSVKLTVICLCLASKKKKKKKNSG